MSIMFIKIGLIIVVLLAVSVLVTRRMFSCLTRCDAKVGGDTPYYYKMVDPCIAGIIAVLNPPKKLRGRK